MTTREKIEAAVKNLEVACYHCAREGERMKADPWGTFDTGGDYQRQENARADLLALIASAPPEAVTVHLSRDDAGHVIQALRWTRDWSTYEHDRECNRILEAIKAALAPGAAADAGEGE